VLGGFFLIAAASGDCRQSPWPLWNAYANRFIDEQGRVIDHNAGDRTTSEGQAYAMFFALADNDRVRFNRLLEWTEKNLAGGSLADRLPGWLWGRTPSGEWKLQDAGSAADADCWMAYSLVEAGRLWNNQAYALLGRQMMDSIAKQEVADVPGFGVMLMPGATAQFVHGQTWTLNPSYVPLFLFQRFDAIDPHGPWGAIALNIPRLLRDSARAGFAMDWVNYQNDDGFTPAPSPDSVAASAPVLPGSAQSSSATSTASAHSPESSKPAAPAPDARTQAQTTPTPAAPRTPTGSFDAIRVYLWAGMTNTGDGARAELMAAVPGMGTYLAQHSAPPEKVSVEGIPQPQSGPVGFSAALLPYLSASPGLEKSTAQLRIQLNQQLDTASGLYGKDPAYYDQNLILFAMGFLDERFRFGPHGELIVGWTKR
jgi:endo-1,4-beta-D-glucanase Y